MSNSTNKDKEGGGGRRSGGQRSGGRGGDAQGPGSTGKNLLLLSSLIILVLIVIFIVIRFFPGQRMERPAETQGFHVAVFIPGFTEGSPIYEMLAAGAEQAAAEFPRTTVDVIEGGFNQAEWQVKVTSLAATNSYDLILTSNPAMPTICSNVAEDFPNQKFAVMDGYLKGHPRIYTLLFNQREEGYLIGYMAGLVTTSNMTGVNPSPKVGLIVGQRYPVMDQAIKPGFEEGLKDAVSDGRVDFRVVGNWYDANKAANLSQSMFDAGVDVILTIAGSANLGVLKAAKETGLYALWFDANGYALEPGTIVGCTLLKNDRAAYETVKLFVEGQLPFGEARVVGVKEGYIDFVTEDDSFKEFVPRELQSQMESLRARFKSGEMHLEMPEL